MLSTSEDTVYVLVDLESDLRIADLDLAVNGLHTSLPVTRLLRTAAKLTQKAADSDSAARCLVSIVSTLPSSGVNDGRFCGWNDICTKLRRPISHQLTGLLGTLHQTPRHPFGSCSTETLCLRVSDISACLLYTSPSPRDS